MRPRKSPRMKWQRWENGDLCAVGEPECACDGPATKLHAYQGDRPVPRPHTTEEWIDRLERLQVGRITSKRTLEYLGQEVTITRTWNGWARALREAYADRRFHQ